MTGTPVKLTDDAGRVRFEGLQQGGGGGSQTFEVVHFKFAYNTPGIVVTGVPIGYTPAVGSVLGMQTLSITTPWNGTTPSFYLYSQGADPINNGDYLLAVTDLTTQNAFNVPGWDQMANENVAPPMSYIASSEVPLLCVIDDRSGGDPGADQGEAELILEIFTAVP